MRDDFDGRWSAAADLAALSPGARPRCPACGGALALRGPETRHLTTTHEPPLALRRHYAVRAACGAALPPWLRNWACGLAR